MKKNFTVALLMFCLYGLFLPVAGLSSTFRGDINESGKVDVFDLLSLLTIMKSDTTPGRTTQHIANMDKSAGDKLDIFDVLALLKVISGKAEPEPIEWRAQIHGPVEEGIISPEDTLTFLFETFGGRAPIPQPDVFLFRWFHGNMHNVLINRKLSVIQQDSTTIKVKLPWTYLGGSIHFIDNMDTLATHVVSAQGNRDIGKMLAKVRQCFDHQWADNLRRYLHQDLCRQMITTRYDSTLSTFVKDTIPAVTVADSLQMAFEDFFELFADRNFFKPGESFTNTWDFDVSHESVRYYPDSDSATLHISIGSQMLPPDTAYINSLAPEYLARFDEYERIRMGYYVMVELPLSFEYNACRITSVDALLSILRTKEYWLGRLAKEAAQN